MPCGTTSTSCPHRPSRSASKSVGPFSSPPPALPPLTRLVCSSQLHARSWLRKAFRNHRPRPLRRRDRRDRPSRQSPGRLLKATVFAWLERRGRPRQRRRNACRTCRAGVVGAAVQPRPSTGPLSHRESPPWCPEVCQGRQEDIEPSDSPTVNPRLGGVWEGSTKPIHRPRTTLPPTTSNSRCPRGGPAANRVCSTRHGDPSPARIVSVCVYLTCSADAERGDGSPRCVTAIRPLAKL
ncbi:hypothetical protein LX86_002085 [Lentzea aerocolonigenes]|nr:hypothetical protein [Lentzea aerocolonigenes]